MSNDQITSLLLQTLPILTLLIVGGGKAIICGVIAYHLSKTRRINRTCAVLAGIFGGIASLFLIGMLEKESTAD